MTSCDDCGQLTGHATYQRKPHWIRCPRCQDFAERRGLVTAKRCKYCGAELEAGECPRHPLVCGRNEPKD